MFITLEGGEGSGKSTVADELVNSLKSDGQEVVLTREPGGCALAERIRDLLLHRGETAVISDEAELCLFIAGRVQHLEEVIRPALARGAVVICDRFNDSTIAYQGYGRGLGVERVTALCDLACNGLSPDLTLLFDIDPEIGLKRAAQVGQADRIETEKLDFHRRVRTGYLELAKLDPARIFIVDASLPLKEVIAHACAARHSR